MAIEQRTLQELIKEERAKTASAYQAIAGTPRYNLLQALADLRAAAAYLTASNLDYLLRQIFPDTANGEYLREHWRDRVPPLEPSTAKGDIVLTGTDGVVVPAGALWRSASGQLYAQQAQASIAAGNATVVVQAQEAGSAANRIAGELLSLASSILPGLNSEATVGQLGIGGGADAETDEDYRARIVTYERQGVRIGRQGDWVAWAVDSSPEVTKAWEFANYNESGALLIQVISGSQLTAVGQVQGLDTVRGYLARVAPVALVEVRTPTIVAVDLTITLQPAEDSAQARQLINSNIKQLYEAIAAPGSKITEAEIRSVVEDGVLVTSADVQIAGGDRQFSLFELTTHGAITWA